jgi:hypothetical protein
MWPYHLIVFAGLGLLAAATLEIARAVPSTPGGGIPPSSGALFLVLILVGGVLGMSGMLARRGALNELAYPPCRKCGQTNLWTSQSCRRCGAPVEVSADLWATRPARPAAGTP